VLSSRRWLTRHLFSLRSESLEKLANTVIGLNWVTEPQRRIHPVVIPSANALYLDVSAVVELGKNPMDRAFSDPYESRNVSLPEVTVAIEGEEYVTVIRQERPASTRLSDRRTHANST
jgi:hypothetical protein